jgi:hypothetical protein
MKEKERQRRSAQRNSGATLPNGDYLEFNAVEDDQSHRLTYHGDIELNGFRFGVRHRLDQARLCRRVDPGPVSAADRDQCGLGGRRSPGLPPKPDRNNRTSNTA